MDNKHYYTLNNFYREKFGCKVFKVSLDAGFTCPNKITGGCTFCTSTPYIGNKNESLFTQFENIKNMLHKKWKDAKYIAYFEAGTNTYADVDTLKSTFEPLLKIKNLVGINIGTRPDCLDEDVLDYLESLSKKTYLTIELGVQSMHNKSLKLINRGHDSKIVETAIKSLKERNMCVVAHIINGLPNETKDDMIETVKKLNKLGIDGIKIHMLYLEQGSTISKEYEEQKFHILTKDEYIDIVCTQLRYLNKNVVIHRITSDPDKDKIKEPLWLLKKFVVLNDIDKYLKSNNIYQGDLII